METENKTIQNMDFLGSPVAKTPRFHCRGRGPTPGLAWEDSTCWRAPKPMCHNYWACTLEPMPLSKGSHCNEQPPLAATRESPCAATKIQGSQRLKKKKIKFKFLKTKKKKKKARKWRQGPRVRQSLIGSLAIWDVQSLLPFFLLYTNTLFME